MNFICYQSQDVNNIPQICRVTENGLAAEVGITIKTFIVEYGILNTTSLSQNLVLLMYTYYFIHTIYLKRIGLHPKGLNLLIHILRIN